MDLSYNPDGSFGVISRYEDLAATMLVATSTFGYDSAGRLTSLGHDQGVTSLAAYTWTYDAASRITQFVSPDGTADYGYDATHQITTADHDFQADEAFDWDENGNPAGAGSTVTAATGSNPTAPTTTSTTVKATPPAAPRIHPAIASSIAGTTATG